MTMIAFDTNRNGSIDEKEFIKCISEARENAPPAQDLSPLPSVAKVSSKVSFSLENSISMIGDQDDNEEDYDVNKLVIRVIFENAKMPPNTLSQLAQKNLSILDAYWSKVDFQIDEGDFNQQYVHDSSVLTEDQAVSVYQALNTNFATTVQKALNTIFESLRHSSSKLNPVLMKKVKSLKLDKKGMVDDMTVKQLFASIHFNDKDLFNKFCALYENVTRQDCRYADFQKIFSKVQLIKTLLLSSETLQTKQEGVNGFVLATGIWLQDFDTLYENTTFESDWREIFFKYLAVLYDAMDASKTAKQLHASMSAHTKMLKNINFKKWIGFLDNNNLRAVSSQNQKCIYMSRQIRTILPAFMDKQMTLTECLTIIEAEVGKYRGVTSIQKEEHKQTTTSKNKVVFNQNSEDEAFEADQAAAPLEQSTSKISTQKNLAQQKPSSLKPVQQKPVQQKQPAPQKNAPQKPIQQAPSAVKSAYKSTRENPILVDIEETIGGPIQDVILPYADQQVVQATELQKSFSKRSKNITKEQMISLFKASGGLDAQKNVKIMGLVNLLNEEAEEQELVNNALLQLAASIDQPIRKTLQDLLIGWEDGIVKDEFLSAFSNLRQPIDKWSLVCLFYHFDLDDAADETVQFETIVKILSVTKGVPYQKPGPAEPKAKRPESGVQVLVQSANTVSTEVIASASGFVDDLEYEINKIMRGLNIQLVEQTAADSIDEKETGIHLDDFMISTEVVLKVVGGLFRLQKILLNPKTIKSCMYKLQKWMQSFTGDDEEGAFQYLQKQTIDAFDNHAENLGLTETNALIMRYAFFTIKDANNETLFSLFELMIITFMLTEQDGFHQLELDTEFNMEVFQIHDYNENEMAHFVAKVLIRLQRRVILAGLILSEEQRCQQLEHHHFDVCNDEVWLMSRFSSIVHHMIEKLKDPKIKKALLDFFAAKGYKDEKQMKHDELTYWEFRILFQEILGIRDVSEWQFADFMDNLDSASLGFIELNDIAVWLKKFNFDLGVPIKQIDQSDIINKKLAIGPEEYQIDEQKDYWRGVPTILNSEVAALAKCLELVKELDRDELFFDKDFGPQSEDDIEGSAASMYCNGVKPQSHPEPASVAWLRPSEYLDEGQTAHFVKDSASANEVKQGALGDCWFIGALSVIATKDELLRGRAEHVAREMINLLDADTASMLSSGVYPPIFHKFRSQSIYVIRFFKNNAWRYVIIDDRLPTYKGNQQLVFGKCTSNDELWVPLIEKAYAKLHGCYQTLISGFIDDGLADMTAMVCEKLTLHNKAGEFDDSQKEKLWRYLENMKNNDCLMGCSVTGGTEKSIRIDGVDTGIMSGHAYSLNDVFEIPNEEKEGERKTHRLLRIRNPWGRGEWKGKWSDESEEIEKYANKLEDYIQTLGEDEQFQLGANDGTFLINYGSFRDIYNRLFVVNNFPNDWSAVRFDAKWTSQCSGGLPIEKTAEANKRFAKNPQFIFQADEDCELFVSLHQQDGREKTVDGKYSKYPFEDRIVSTMLFLFELPEGMDRLEAYGSPEPIEKATPKVLHEISFRFEPKANKKYVIIPSPRKPDTLGDFTLSFYTNRAMHEFDVKRVDDPSCRYSFILEEYEKNERRVPNWKIKWCKDNLKYMIGASDEARDQSMSTSLVRQKTIAKKASPLRKAGTKSAAELQRVAASLADAVDDDEENCNLD